MFMDKKVKAWAVVSAVDGFLPDFNVIGKMNNVHQIHSKKSSAEKMAKDINANCDGEKLWLAVPCEITYSVPPLKE